MIAASITARRVWITLCALVLALGLAACEKIVPAPRIETIPAIPADYGELVGITPHGVQPWITVLWFQKPDKTIVGMGVNLVADSIIREPLVTIPRK